MDREPACGEPGANFQTKVSETTTKAGHERAVNRYAGRCEICGHHVAAGAGCVDKGNSGRWVVVC